jgi:hypothetical protein
MMPPIRLVGNIPPGVVDDMTGLEVVLTAELAPAAGVDDRTGGVTAANPVDD